MVHVAPMALRRRSLLPMVGVLHAAVGAIGSADPDDFPVAAMLQFAVTAGPPSSLKAAATAKGEADKITDACVNQGMSEAWRINFQNSVDLMLHKTRRSMQHGMAGVAEAVIALADSASTTCGSLTAFGRFKGQAERLHVLATSRSLAHLDSKVKYEPLKMLTVGDVDIHKELNNLIVSWQMQKGAEAVGLALVAFLVQFAEDADAPPAITKAAAPPPEKNDLKGTVPYWTDALNEAMKRLGDASRPVGDGCVNAELAERQRGLVSAAFETMMQKSGKGMQQGLRTIASDVLTLLTDLGDKCESVRKSAATAKLQNAAGRLKVLAASRSLLNPGRNVDYDPMKALNVGGLDVHKELNRFIGAWIYNNGATVFGDALADFFEDFREEDEAPDAADEVPAEGGLQRMFRQALVAAGEETDLEPACFNAEAIAAFAADMDAAIVHMLHKRKKTMQQGLKELADATDKLIRGQPALCTLGKGASAIWGGAKKLRKVTRRTAVDYGGTHLKYEAMKSLEVGGVPVHAELNNFLAAWKLRSPEEAGVQFGELMLVLNRVAGYDEL